MSRPGALLAVVLALAGCFGGAHLRLADPDYGVELLTSGGVGEFHAHAQVFYERLALRRVNTFGTFRDPVLRSYFRTEQAFSDYYADLAQKLVEARFERNRPLSVEVQEFVFEGPGRARVSVRLTGADAAPLRFGTQVLERTDRWERADGQWWIVPGKL